MKSCIRNRTRILKVAGITSAAAIATAARSQGTGDRAGNAAARHNASKFPLDFDASLLNCT
jgi:hypothetical protein